MLSFADIARALAEYQRSLVGLNSPYDRYSNGDCNMVSASALRGLELFRGRAQCSTCHVIGEGTAQFTDEGYHMSPLGLPVSVTKSLPALTARVIGLRREGKIRELDRLISSDTRISALGRFNVTLNPADIGLFKTPSLRNVAATAPYMHDGSVSTLHEVVDLELYGHTELRQPIVLTSAEKDDLQEFIARRRQKAMLELAGKLEWDADYDYKKGRSRR